MKNIPTGHTAWQQEQEELGRIYLENPDLLTRTEIPDPDEKLARAGIFGLDDARQNAYLKYKPTDFVVEEVQKNGDVVMVDAKRSVPDEFGDERRTLFCNLIKVNLPTFRAVKAIAEATGVSENSIGYAGIKDAVALTAQRISFRGIEWQDIKDIKIPNILIEPVAYGKGVTERGGLKGNRFTIMLRTEGETDSAHLRGLIDHYSEQGFSNYYGLQRFGRRYEALKMGCFLMRGDIDGCLKTLFGLVGPYDLPLFQGLRQKLMANYGDWKAMQEIIAPFPYAFKDEHVVLKALIKESKKTINALRQIPEQVKIWSYAYASWVMNRYLSQTLRDGNTPPELIPIPVAPDKSHQEFYKQILEQDGVTDPLNALRPFKFIQMKDRKIPSLIRPEVHRVTKVDEGIVFSFTLPKAAYATTYLMHLFRVYEGRPVPGWVNPGEVDVKQIVRLGDLSIPKKYFEEELKPRHNDDDEPKTS